MIKELREEVSTLEEHNTKIARHFEKKKELIAILEEENEKLKKEKEDWEDRAQEFKKEVDAIKKKGNKKQVKFAEKIEKASDEIREERHGIMPIMAAVETNKLASAGVTGLNRVIYDAQNRSGLPGRIVRQEGGEATPDEDVNNIYDRLGYTYDFFKNTYSRNSLDGSGLPLLATVNYRKGYANAFWNGKQMVFGDGDGKLFTDMTGLSIVAHELTHGVVQYSGELDYHGQSGALNESCADVFGALVEQYTLGQTASEASWLIGEGLLGPDVNGVALRSLKLC